MSEDFRKMLLASKPQDINELGDTDTKKQIHRFGRLVERRAAPMEGSERARSYVIFWPRPPLHARAVPEGIMPIDTEMRDGHDQKMEEFFLSQGVDRVIFWGIGFEHNGLFIGPYNEQTRLWIKRDLIVSPTVLIAETKDIVLIADEQWHFSVVGGSIEAISQLEKVFGGPEMLRQHFINWADESGVGFGDEGRKWAYKYLVPWSGWKT